MKDNFCPTILVFLFSVCLGEAAIRFVDGDAAGSGDGSSWSDAYLKLQSALAAAASGDEIWVAEGVYYPDEGGTAVDGVRSSTFSFVSGVALYGGFDGTEGVRDDRDFRANVTVLSGDLNQDDGAGFINNFDNSYRVVTAGNGIPSSSVLDGFTVTAGSASGFSFPDTSGGGAFVSSGASPVFANCSFISNSANSDGGGAYGFATSAPTFTNCIFRGNISGRDGGAMFVNVLSTVTMTNCALQGNLSMDDGGGYYNSPGTISTFVNCSFQGNVADLGGGIYNASGNLVLTNMISWNNRDMTGTGTGSSAFLNDITGGGSVTYRHSLIQGINPFGVGNLDGSDSANNPLFVLEVDPVNSPATGGDLRLQSSSAAIDEGDDAANSEATDLAGNARMVGTIDLGAYEFSAGTGAGTFATFFPGLDPAADANGNGRSNYYDYAAGGDPTAADDLTWIPCFDDGQLTFSYRNNATDVFVKFEKSGSLLSGSWDELEEGTDYAVVGTVVNGAQTLLSVELLTTEAKLFLRQSFSETAL